MSSLAASDLILRPNGTIYHLGLAPDQLAPLIITVGDPGRVSAVSQRFAAITERVEEREFVTHLGHFAGRQLMCISTGVGTDNVDIVLNELDALANIDFATRSLRPTPRALTFMRLGTSGALQPTIPLDSLLVTRSAVGMDGLGSQYPLPRKGTAADLQIDFPRWARGAYSAEGDSIYVHSWERLGAISATTLTCAGFYGPQLRQLRVPPSGPALTQLAGWRDSQDQAIANFEMETAGIYALSQLLGHRAVSVSAVLANRSTGTFSTRPSETVDRMIDLAFASLASEPDVWWPRGG